MSILLSTGLQDLSRELGETAANQTSPRIKHYNDAVTEFSNEQKWTFLIKKNEELTTAADTKIYTIPAAVLADWRIPGAIKAINIGTAEYKPIDYEDRNVSDYDGKKIFYIDPENTQITFKCDLGAADVTITIHYYYIPARTEDLNAGTFPIPDRYRKILSILAAAYVQWGRYLSAEGNRLYNLYGIELAKIKDQQNEMHSFKRKRLQPYPQYKGFRRNYPGGPRSN